MAGKLQNPRWGKGIRQTLSKTGWPANVRLALDVSRSGGGYRRVLPLRRSWPLIVIAAAIDVGMMIPAVSTYGQALRQWHRLDSLFDLTSAVFLTAWFVGWSVAPLILTLLLLVLLAGREVLGGRAGVLQLGIGIPGLILRADYAAHKVANLRLTKPEKQSGTAWRGTHLSFDYDGRQVDFGSAMTEGDLRRIGHELEVLAQGGAAPAPVPAREGPSSQVQSAQAALFSPSLLALIASNLVPVFGALLFGWRLADVMVLYWAESAVIAVFNVAKLACIGRWTAIIPGIFFLAHFSAFMAVHLLFIYGIFIEGMKSSGGGDLTAVAAMFVSLWPALAALFASHAVSFVSNFIGNMEYERTTLQRQMAAPYRRIVFMHLTVISGGFITMVLHDPGPVLLLFILVKTLVDARAHMKEHRRI